MLLKDSGMLHATQIMKQSASWYCTFRLTPRCSSPEVSWISISTCLLSTFLVPRKTSRTVGSYSSVNEFFRKFVMRQDLPTEVSPTSTSLSCFGPLGFGLMIGRGFGSGCFTSGSDTLLTCSKFGVEGSDFFSGLAGSLFLTFFYSTVLSVVWLIKFSIGFYVVYGFMLRAESTSCCFVQDRPMFGYFNQLFH